MLKWWGSLSPWLKFWSSAPSYFWPRCYTKNKRTMNTSSPYCTFSAFRDPWLHLPSLFQWSPTLKSHIIAHFSRDSNSGTSALPAIWSRKLTGIRFFTFFHTSTEHILYGYENHFQLNHKATKIVVLYFHIHFELVSIVQIIFHPHLPSTMVHI